jgi:hypothetical protein
MSPWLISSGSVSDVMVQQNFLRPAIIPIRVSKSGASGRDPVLHGVWKWAAHPACGGTALSKAPCALADSLMLVFQHSDRAGIEQRPCQKMPGWFRLGRS